MTTCMGCAWGTRHSRQRHQSHGDDRVLSRRVLLRGPPCWRISWRSCYTYHLSWSHSTRTPPASRSALREVHKACQASLSSSPQVGTVRVSRGRDGGIVSGGAAQLGAQFGHTLSHLRVLGSPLRLHRRPAAAA